MRQPNGSGGVIEHSPARATNFRPFIAEFPNVAFHMTDAMIPAVNVPEMSVPYSSGPSYLSDNKVDFELLTLGFTVDEHFNSYIEIFQWFMDMASPVGGREENVEPVEITIVALDNNKNPTVHFKFSECRPTALGQITYDTQDEQNNQLVSDITFRYDMMRIVRAGEELPTGLDSAAGEMIP